MTTDNVIKVKQGTVLRGNNFVVKGSSKTRVYKSGGRSLGVTLTNPNVEEETYIKSLGKGESLSTNPNKQVVQTKDGGLVTVTQTTNEQTVNEPSVTDQPVNDNYNPANYQKEIISEGLRKVQTQQEIEKQSLINKSRSVQKAEPVSIYDKLKARIYQPIKESYETTLSNPAKEFRERVVKTTGDKPKSAGGILALSSASSISAVADPVGTLTRLPRTVFYDIPKGLYDVTTSSFKEAIASVDKKKSNALFPLAPVGEVVIKGGALTTTRLGEGLVTSAIQNPVEFALISKTPDVIASGLGKAKDVYIKTGSEFIEPTKVFEQSVLEGKETFPMSKGTKESIKSFESSNTGDGLVVQTSSPSKISGTEVKVKGDAGKGLEDTGIYTTPAGRGSPYFLRLKDSNTPTVYSFNPLEGIRSSLGVPTVTKFQVKEVTTYPESVLNAKGFESVAEFQKGNIGKGQVYITKRSMIGQGEISGQGYKGTSEIEAVIGVGERFSYNPKTTVAKIKGFDKYTVYKDKPVAIREAKLITDADVKLGSKGSSVISSEKLIKESEYLNSPYESVKTISTYSSVDYGKPIESSVSSSKSSSSSVSSVDYGKPIESSVSSSKSSSSKSSYASSYTSISPPKPPKGYSPYYNKKDDNKGSFLALAKVKGKFTPVGYGKNIKETFSYGKSYVQGTSSATFKVVKAGSLKGLDINDNSNFKKKKTDKEGFVYIEPSKNRINTIGELQQITYKGISTQKNKGGKKWF